MIRALISSALLATVAAVTLATMPRVGVDIEEAPRTAAVLHAAGLNGTVGDGCECVYVPVVLAPVAARLARTGTPVA
jgi:hypothetical protein